MTEFNGIRRLNTMPNLGIRPVVPDGQEVPDAQDDHIVAEVKQDPAIQKAMVKGVGPDLQNGNGQAVQFAAQHHASPGRDWDLNSAAGMLETAQKAVAKIKKDVAGAEKLSEFERTVTETIKKVSDAHQQGEVGGLQKNCAEFKTILDELKQARAALTDAVKDGSGTGGDPREGLAQILKTLRVFRYEMQVEFGKKGLEIGKMDAYEGALREIQHAFTFKVGSKVPETLFNVMLLEHQLNNKLSEINGKLSEIAPGTPPVKAPNGVWLADTIGDVLELSHRTNDQIRDFQDTDKATAGLRDIVGEIALKGGSRKVELSIGAGALIGLGFSSAAVAGIRVGARVRVIGDVQCAGKGRPISVTFRLALGAEAKAAIEAGKASAIAGAKAQAVGGGEISRFVTRSYQTLDDFILDAKRNKFATSRTLVGAFLGGLKSLGRSIGSLGTKFFRWLGRKSGDIKQDNAQYLQTLKDRGVAGSLDGLLAKRLNPVIVAERKGKTLLLKGEAKGSVKIRGGVIDISAKTGASHERDYKVKSFSYAPVARVIKSAKDKAALNAMMRAESEGGGVLPVPNYNGATSQDVIRSIQTSFEDAVREAEEAADRSKGVFTFTDTVGFSKAANKIRTLMLATELAAREGRISRGEADRLLDRFSNPPVKFPPKVFQEYFMEGTGAAKPAKIRNSFTAEVKLGLFKNVTDDLTKGIGSSIGKAVAEGGVNTMRREVGLDTACQYRFSSEKPVKPGADRRPWENVVRTTHELAVSGSMPARIIIDAITRTYINKGERLENKSQNLGKDVAKDLAADIGKDTLKITLGATLPGLILATVKETAVAAVKKWLSDPENVKALVLFAIDHLGDAFDLIVGAVEFVADHPNLVLHIAASIAGASNLGESERYKTIKWTCVDGAFETVTVSSETQSKMGINVDPVGVGLGFGFDISYSVTESVKERDCTPRPSLTMLLGKTEEFLFGETGLTSAGNGEAFKNWLSRNAMGVSYMLDNMMSDANREKTEKIYADALKAVSGDAELKQRLQKAWQAATSLPADATLDAKIEAARELLVAMTLAYRSPTGV